MSQATLVIKETPLDAIRLHPRNLRRQVGDVAEMAQSMKERGVLEPLIVAPGLDEEAGVVLIAGHRRLAAAKLAKLATVPTIFRSDLDSEDAYNTYRHAGLPPGPIANPGLASIKAVLGPENSDALFFVLRPDGSGGHQFSNNMAAHEAAIAKYRNGQK